jgi:hypothetical protein
LAFDLILGTSSFMSVKGDFSDWREIPAQRFFSVASLQSIRDVKAKVPHRKATSRFNVCVQ